MLSKFNFVDTKLLLFRKYISPREG